MPKLKLLGWWWARFQIVLQEKDGLRHMTDGLPAVDPNTPPLLRPAGKRASHYGASRLRPGRCLPQIGLGRSVEQCEFRNNFEAFTLQRILRASNAI
jgi:hypothetical protein